MNRFLSVVGFLATGTLAFWFLVFLSLPFHLLTGSPQPWPKWLLFWGLWSALSLLGVSVVYGFVRFSMRAHWAALRQNSRLPGTAWKGVCGVYVLLMVLFGVVFFAMPSGQRPLEKGLYGVLFGGSMTLAGLGLNRGFSQHTQRNERDAEEEL